MRAAAGLAGVAAAIATLAAWPIVALAHDVARGDRAFVAAAHGPAIAAFLYLGAKHMVTGYDHILYLVGVLMALRRLRDILLYVSMFTIGHSLTLLLGVIFRIGANSHLVDAIIGLSIVYKGIENLGILRRIGWSIDPRIAILAFGLSHGLGLATKLLDLTIAPDGLIVNLVSFNLGVEVGQMLLLFFVVSLFNIWRTSPTFPKGAVLANWMLVGCGTAIIFDQAGEFLTA